MTISLFTEKDFIKWKATQLHSRIKNNLARKVRQVESKDLALAGAYHGLNVGDNALYDSVKSYMRGEAKKIDLYHLNEYPKYKKIIIGGGAVGVLDNIRTLMRYYAPSQVYMIGVDFSGDLLGFDDDVLSYLSNVSFISTRSKSQHEKFSTVLSQMKYAPDNAFVLDSFQEVNPIAEPKRLGVNLMNLFLYWDGRRFVPGSPMMDWYKVNDPSLASYINTIGPAYLESMKEVVHWYAKQGWEVTHFPFTPVDEYLAAKVFKGVPIILNHFDPSPVRLIQEISKMDMMISTRFHAMVFSLLAGVPLLPVYYAKKCEDLMTDLGLDIEVGVRRTEFVESPKQAIEKLTAESAICFSGDELMKVQKEVKDNFSLFVNALS